jgi:hypothetical protein
MKETIALLNRVHEEKKEFSFGDWGRVTLDPTTKEHCGTRACAAGYMALHKPFQEQGLLPSSLTYLVPTFYGFKGTWALAAFLDISRRYAMDIFVHGYSPGYILNYRHIQEVTAKDIAILLQTLLDSGHAPKFDNPYNY